MGPRQIRPESKTLLVCRNRLVVKSQLSERPAKIVESIRAATVEAERGTIRLCRLHIPTLTRKAKTNVEQALVARRRHRKWERVRGIVSGDGAAPREAQRLGGQRLERG